MAYQIFWGGSCRTLINACFCWYVFKLWNILSNIMFGFLRWQRKCEAGRSNFSLKCWNVATFPSIYNHQKPRLSVLVKMKGFYKQEYKQRHRVSVHFICLRIIKEWHGPCWQFNKQPFGSSRESLMPISYSPDIGCPVIMSEYRHAQTSSFCRLL